MTAKINTRHWGIGYRGENGECYLFSHDEIFMSPVHGSREVLLDIYANKIDSVLSRLLGMARYAESMPEHEKPLALHSKAIRQLHRVFNYYDQGASSFDDEVQALTILIKHYPTIASEYSRLIQVLGIPDLAKPVDNPDGPALDLLAKMFDVSSRLGSTVTINADHAAILNRLIRNRNRKG